MTSEARLSPEHILQTGLAFWASKTLLSAVELELFTELARKPHTAAELQSRLGLHPRSARDFLDALVALGFLERKDGVYSNTPATDLFLDKHKPSYVGGILEMANHRLFRFWGSLTEALRTGKPQNEAQWRESMFASLYSDPERLKGFLKAMTGISRGASLAIAAKFPWSRLQDLRRRGHGPGRHRGAGRPRSPSSHGHRLRPRRGRAHLRGICDGARARAAPPIRGRRLLQGPAAEGRCLHMGHILHDWDLVQKKLIIKKAWDALVTGAPSSSTSRSSTTTARRTLSA
jgi:hypothetical protein